MKIKDVCKAIGEFELNNVAKYLRVIARILLKGYLSASRLCSKLLIVAILYCAAHIGYAMYIEEDWLSLVFLNSGVYVSDLTATVGVMLLGFCFLKYSVFKIKM